MLIKKSEAIALNLWERIKEVKDITEGSIECMQESLGKIYPLGASFPESVLLWTEFPQDMEFELSPGEILIMSKEIQKRDNLFK